MMTAPSGPPEFGPQTSPRTGRTRSTQRRMKGNTVNHTITPRQRLSSVLGVAAIAVGSVAFLAAPALAAPGDGEIGSITVHKLEQPEGNLGPNDGTEIDIDGAVPLEAGFTVCEIEAVNLAEAADWERLIKLEVTLVDGEDPIVTEGEDTHAVDCGTEQKTTLPEGVAVFDNLASDRAYVVYESTPAANSVSVASPTVIGLPFPGNGAEGQPAWNYHPHLYPKNIVAGSGATKNGEIIGDFVTFDITVPINPLGTDKEYDEFRINDQLSDFLTYEKGAVVLTNASGGDVTLAEGTDYTLTPAPGGGGDLVEFVMLEPGLNTLDDTIGGKIVLTIEATATGKGSTANEAEITINGATTDPGTGPEVPDPEDIFAGAHILKEAKNKGAESNVPLAKAEFDLYAVGDSATDCPATPEGDPVKTAQVSGDDGKTPDMVLGEGKYCAYETVVPAGYKGLPGGQLLTVDGDDAFTTVVNTQIGSDEGDLPDLPITGAVGNVLLVLGGAALVTVAGLLINSRRKRRQQGS